MLDVLGHELRPPRCLSLRGKKWKYRGEGNANLVLALTQERKIVRLRKKEKGSLLALEEEEEEERERVLRETVFCRCIMVPLLGESFIQPPVAAYLEQGEVVCLDRILRAQRPAYRHHKELHFSHVTVYPDYALLPLHLDVDGDPFPTFCVEVKPKQGWIPRSDRRLSKCTFCLNQYLKLKIGSIQNRSQYCPLDLFSGIHSRMKSALHNLLLSPQNNLKIFKDGALVYGDEGNNSLEEVLQSWLGKKDEHKSFQTLVENFSELVYKALTSNLGSEKMCTSLAWDDMEPGNSPHFLPGHLSCERIPASVIARLSPLLPEPVCNWSAEPLPQDCILDRILRIQKLEQYGADFVHHMYHSDGYDLPRSDYSYVASLLKSNHNMTPIHRYLLAATAKDCSIMISFQQCNLPCYKITNHITQHHILKDLDAQSYIFNIGVSDLDPKPMSCIEKHRKRDCDIMNACLEILESS